MERRETERALNRYLEKKRCGGRSILGRWLDYVLLRIVFFAGAYLFFMEKLAKRGAVVALSFISLFLFMLLLRVLRELSTERFLRREYTRVRALLLTDRLLLLEQAKAVSLCRPLCGSDETPLILQQASAASADALLPLVRKSRHGGKLAVLCCGGFDATAEALAVRSGGQIRLIPAQALIDEATEAGLSPNAAEIRACLAAEAAASLKKRKRSFVRPTAPGGARQYVLAALLLTVCSFFTSYALYYRLLAGLCSAVAALGLALRAARKSAF